MATDTPEARPAIRVLVALGNAERERRLVPGLVEAGDLAVVGRCLAADQLLQSVQQRSADVALVALDLHRLSASILTALAMSRIPLVGVATRPDDVQTEEPWAAVLPPSAEADQVRAAIVAAATGQRVASPKVSEPEAEPPAPAECSPETSGVVAVMSGKGSPGCTTIAVNLAAALGAIEPAVLVDLDLSGPAVAAALGLDPTRNLFMVAHAEPKNAREWHRALDQECQPLAKRSPHGVVLTGIPKAAMRQAITIPFLERLLAELQARYRYVVIDAGSVAEQADGMIQSWLAAVAGQVLFVTAASVTGAWNARTALATVPQLQQERTALLINQHDRRLHHSRSEVEWALGRPSAAVIPFDHRAVEQAAGRQQPVIFARRTRAGQALLDLAGRLHGGDVLLPPEETSAKRTHWHMPLPSVRFACPPRLRAPRLPWPRRSGPVPDGTPAAPSLLVEVVEEVSDGHRTATV